MRTISDVVTHQAEQLVAEAVRRQHVDGVTDLATALPLSVVPDLVGWPEDGLKLPLNPSPGAAPRLLTWDEDHLGAGGLLLRPGVLDLTQWPPFGLQIQPTASDHIE